MPHIILEYTQGLSLDIPKMLDEMHYDLAGRETVNLRAIKTRAIPVQYTIVGDADQRDKFIHIVIKLLAGRPEKLRREMAEALQAIAYKYIGHAGETTVSVDVVEMNTATYVKEKE